MSDSPTDSADSPRTPRPPRTPPRRGQARERRARRARRARRPAAPGPYDRPAADSPAAFPADSPAAFPADSPAAFPAALLAAFPGLDDAAVFGGPRPPPAFRFTPGPGARHWRRVCAWPATATLASLWADEWTALRWLAHESAGPAVAGRPFWTGVAAAPYSAGDMAGSQGGVFQLLAKDEKFDKYLTASAALRDRIVALAAEREAAGLEPALPAVAELAPWVVPVRSEFRPHVQVASEYARVRMSGDGAKLRATPGGLTADLPVYGSFVSDMFLRIRIAAFGNRAAFDAADPDAVPTEATPLLRYCAYPGLRLVRRARLTSDQMVVDEYTRDEAAMRNGLFVAPANRAAVDACLGQAPTKTGAYSVRNITAYAPYSDGAQTPKYWQEALELLIPLDFWFCRSPDQALFNDLVSNTGRRLTIELAPLGELVRALVPATAPLAPGELAGDYREVPLPFDALDIEAELFSNNLFVAPEIHALYAARAGFSLVRTHRAQVTPLDSTAPAVKLDQLKFPAEYFMVGVRARANAASFDHWHLMGAAPARVPYLSHYVAAGTWNTTNDVVEIQARRAADTSSLAPVVARLGLSAMGTTLYPLMPPRFYSAYLPQRYASPLVASPTDSSLFLVPICLRPGEAQPSGSFNLSAVRETYLNLELADGVRPADVEVVVAVSALNFLVRVGDQLTLRYQL